MSIAQDDSSNKNRIYNIQ